MFRALLHSKMEHGPVFRSLALSFALKRRLPLNFRPLIPTDNLDRLHRTSCANTADWKPAKTRFLILSRRRRLNSMSSSDEDDFMPLPQGRDTKYTNEQHEKFKRQMKADRAASKKAADSKASTRAPNIGKEVIPKPSPKEQADQARRPDFKKAPARSTTPSIASGSTSPTESNGFPFEKPPPARPSGLEQLIQGDTSKKVKTKLVKTKVRKDSASPEESSVNQRAKKLFSQAKPWEAFEAGEVDLSTAGKIRDESAACSQLLAHVRSDPQFKISKSIPSYYTDTLYDYTKKLAKLQA